MFTSFTHSKTRLHSLSLRALGVEQCRKILLFLRLLKNYFNFFVEIFFILVRVIYIWQKLKGNANDKTNRGN